MAFIYLFIYLSRDSKNDLLVQVLLQSKAENTYIYNYKTPRLKDNLIIDLNIG